MLLLVIGKIDNNSERFLDIARNDNPMPLGDRA